MFSNIAMTVIYAWGWVLSGYVIKFIMDFCSFHRSSVEFRGQYCRENNVVVPPIELKYSFRETHEFQQETMGFCLLGPILLLKLIMK